MKKEISNNKWLCLYIYIPPPFEHFLVNCLYTITDNLFLHKLINKFFFIRYGEGGHHIRFRAHFYNKSVLELYEKIITQQILEYIHKYNIPCSSKEGRYVLPKSYAPEFDRYLGRYGVKIAEDVFQNSSITIMKQIKLSPTWNYKTAIITAIVINYSMIYSFTLSNKTLINFFLFNCKKWFPSKFKIDRISISEFEKVIDQYYYYSYNSLKNITIPLIKNLFFELKSNKIQSENYKLWFKNTSELHSTLSHLIEEKKIILQGGSGIWSLYESYAHMNNNRLGIMNKDESFISYLILKSLKESNLNG